MFQTDIKILVDLVPQNMTDTDFFKDFHGAQILKDAPEVQYTAAE